MIFFIQRNCETNKTKKNLDKDNSQNFSLHNFDQEKNTTTLKFLSPRNIMCFFRPFLHLTGRTLPWKIIIEYIGVSVGTWKIKLFIKEVEGIMPTRYMSFFLHKTWHLFGLIFFLFACPGFLLGSYLNRVNLDYNNYVQSLISIE